LFLTCLRDISVSRQDTLLPKLLLDLIQKASGHRAILVSQSRMVLLREVLCTLSEPPRPHLAPNHLLRDLWINEIVSEARSMARVVSVSRYTLGGLT